MLNSVDLQGRLVDYPAIKELNSEEGITIIVAQYRNACQRDRKTSGQPDADFICCCTFGKRAMWVEAYLRKTMVIIVKGSLRSRSYKNKYGYKNYITEILVDKHYFCGKKEEWVF